MLSEVENLSHLALLVIPLALQIVIALLRKLATTLLLARAAIPFLAKVRKLKHLYPSLELRLAWIN